MPLTIVTEPSIEPVSLADMKEHLRVNSASFATDVSLEMTITPGSHATAASYGLTGSTVGSNVYTSLVLLQAGTAGTGATLDTKIQESDDAASWSDWSGSAFTQITTSNDNSVEEIEYTGGKAYIRAVSEIAGAACNFGVSVVLDSVTSSEDDYITGLIKVSRRQIERISNEAFIQQTWDLYLDDFPAEDFIDVPLPPVSTVSSVTYTGSDDTEYTLTAGTYSVDKFSYPARITLDYSEQWPSTTLQTSNAVKVRFNAGYGATVGSVPEHYRHAIKLLTGHYYEHRESVTNMRLSEIPEGIEDLIFDRTVYLA